MGKLRLREGRREQRGWGRAREGGRRKGKQGVGEERGGLLKVTAIQKPRKLQKEWYVRNRNSKKGEEMLVSGPSCPRRVSYSWIESPKCSQCS